MDGARIQSYWSKEISALLTTYRQFETLIPSQEHKGAAHPGEDGRFVEDLVREYLSKFLPKGLEVLTGFILRPAVKTGLKGKERKGEKDEHSSQLDIIIYDSELYPVFQRFGNSVIVPPEGVIAVISIKKHLHDQDISHECNSLLQVSKLCRTLKSNGNNDKVRGPYLGVVCMDSKIEKKKTSPHEWIFNEIKTVYSKLETPKFDDFIGFIGSLSGWSIFKRRPGGEIVKKAEYLYLQHIENELHFGLQFVLTGILSVYYDETRRNVRRPGFTAFPNRNVDLLLGKIDCDGVR